MSLEQQTKRLARAYGVHPKKRLGQNFMTSDRFFKLIASYAELTRSDVVLEVGAGFGFLTQHLARKARRVVAVEVDRRLVNALGSQLAGWDNVDLVEGNILEAPIPAFDKVVANPPFSISSPLLFWLLQRRFASAVLTFQEEFARRLCAQPGSRDYSRLTVATHIHAGVELLDTVPKEAFYPMPDVNAVIVRLTPRQSLPFKLKDEQIFNELLRSLFSQRNRKVRKAAIGFFRKQHVSDAEASKQADRLPFKDRRVRDLSPDEFGALANELSQ
jgi:16S rRNA (adenine1518-N6/adenine1519-N6)-dimethyltransferase